LYRIDAVILAGTTRTPVTGDTDTKSAEVVILTQVSLNTSVGSRVRGLASTVNVFALGQNNVVQANAHAGIELRDEAAALNVGTTPGRGACVENLNRSFAAVGSGEAHARLKGRGVRA